MDRKTVVLKSSAPKKIAKIQFGVLPSEEIQKVAELQVSSRELFQMPARNAAANGCMDPRLGISDKQSSCKTCNKKLVDCSGHFGYIQLEVPVFHVGYFKHTLNILQCICKRCSRVMLPDIERINILKRMKNPNLDALGKSALFKRVVDMCKRCSKCQLCGYPNGVVKKVGGGCFKIVHEKHRSKHSSDQTEIFQHQTVEIVKSHPDLKQYLAKPSELLHPLRAYELILQVTDEDMTLLWMNGRFCRPDNLIIWSFPVPPVPIRPSVPQETGGGSTEDDLTVKLQEIIEMNNALKMALDKGATMKMIAEDWEFLQIQVALFINGETPGIPRHLLGTKAIRGLCQRLKGKQGRFRGNLSGKRVDFSSRTVISPDPNLGVDQVGIPSLVAKIMTYPERVNRYNISKLRKAVLNGPDIHPGANIIRTDTFALTLQFANRETAANNLKEGDIVERHMHDGDIVLFNRQPSLHKMSIMSHRVKVYPWRTFRFNECACTPYNADFDGDEMNMHLPQTEEARTEATELMGITNNLVTPRSGEPLVAATQDFLTGAYLLTQKDVFFTKANFCRVIAFLSDALEEIDMPLPSIWKPRKLWTGKQIISLLVRPNKKATSFVNLESEEKFYTNDKHFCSHDGFVSFRNGELLSGNLGKKTLGGDSKTSLFYVLIRDYGSKDAVRCMNRLAKLTARYLADRGFSIGINDVTPDTKMTDLKASILKKGQGQASEQIESYKLGKNKLKPGCNALESLESDVNGLLGKIRENCGQAALAALHHRNSPLCMAQCGSKGSPLNISQMVACLGQQSVGGSRIQDGFVNRTLPHFPTNSLFPAAKGFVGNSFFSGLTATEFFFHTMGGREGLVDTAVKTAETGYMARRLMKALEDLSMQYDMTVRNSEQTVVQFSYGDDGLNPQVMEKGDRPVNFPRMLVNVTAKETDIEREEDSLTSNQLKSMIDNELLKNKYEILKPEGHQFLTEIKTFFYNRANELEILEVLETANIDTGVEKYHKNMSKNDIKESLMKLRSRLLSMNQGQKFNWQEDSKLIGSVPFHEANRLLRDNVLRLTSSQVHRILNISLSKYNSAKIEPGEAVGAVGAQSLSEPGTQMTLKTFHFAGVASMNVTLGVPRLKEIINAAKVISTPIIEARLVQCDSMTSARIVKAKIEKTTLGEIAEYIKEVHSGEMSYVSIKLDRKAIQNLHLHMDSKTVKQAILQSVTQKAPILRLVKECHILLVGKSNNRLRVLAPETKETQRGIPSHQKIYFIIQALKAALPNVIVQGIPTVSRAIINEEQDKFGKKMYYLLVEGYGIADVMGCPGVDGTRCKTNHIVELQQVIGIEGARSMIASEINYIMTAYGITVDRRHLMLLSDVMTFKGEVLGITRFGVAKMRESVLMLASFEKTTDHLFDAAVHSREDSIVGVSECIIMGVPIPIGTGIFKLIHKSADKIRINPRTRLLSMI
jgi:DNA-directed RNA polymerase III subunit RPC1